MKHLTALQGELQRAVDARVGELTAPEERVARTAEVVREFLGLHPELASPWPPGYRVAPSTPPVVSSPPSRVALAAKR